MTQMLAYPHIAARLFNTPLLLHPQKLDAIIAGLGSRVIGGGAQLQWDAAAPSAHALPAEMFSTKRGTRSDRGWRMVDGVAVVSAMGALVHRTQLDADSNLLIGYNDLAADLEDAMTHPDVHAVVQVYDSPGGEVAGAFEYAQRVLDMRGRKPLVAVADTLAASAAYLAASAADELVLGATAYAGSIGVVMRHVDFSRALANDGIQVTHIFAGAHKVDGNPFEPLPAGVRADLQADINDLYQLFVQAVVTHRGMADAAVRGTQAATYRGVSAIAAGLADRIGTTDAVIAELAAQRARSYPVGAGGGAAASLPSHPNHEASMTQTTTSLAAAPAAAASPAAAAPAASTNQVDLDSARAAGAAAERARVGAILGHPAAACNAALAQQCITGGLSAEQAQGILDAAQASAFAATAVTATASTAGTGFAQAMQSMANPQISGVEALDGGGDGSNSAAIIQSSWGKAFGSKA